MIQPEADMTMPRGASNDPVLSPEPQDPLKSLYIADPELGKKVVRKLKAKNIPQPTDKLERLVEETFRAMTEEISFGYSVAEGFADLLGQGRGDRTEFYVKSVHDAAKKGPTLGRIVAAHLPPVLIHDTPTLLRLFFETLQTMEAKGTYTLKTPLKVMVELLEQDDPRSAQAWLRLLGDTFSQNLSYNQSLHFSYLLPKAVMEFNPETRHWMIPILARIVRTDFLLVEPFLEGLENGVKLLFQKDLELFARLGLDKLSGDRNRAAKFLSLKSRAGLSQFRRLQVTVPFSEVKNSLNRYLKARMGTPLVAKPVSALSQEEARRSEFPVSVCSDGLSIYLPVQIRVYKDKKENLNLYKCLTRLEAGLYEFGTFDFDLEKLLARSGLDVEKYRLGSEGLSEMEQFFLVFPIKELARDLFTTFEHGRIRLEMNKRYPGIVKRTLPPMAGEMAKWAPGLSEPNLIYYLYWRLALGREPDTVGHIGEKQRAVLESVAALFDNEMQKSPVVETSAFLVIRAYPTIVFYLKKRFGGSFTKERYQRLKIPFQREIRPDLFRRAFGHFDEMAARLKQMLGKKGLTAYKSEIRKELIRKGGVLDSEDLARILTVSAGSGPEDAVMGDSADLAPIDLNDLPGLEGFYSHPPEPGSGKVFWYKEFDCRLNDYVNDHVRVLDRRVEPVEGDFYQRTLQTCQGLASRIRYAFELLKPHGLKVLRPWTEGDDFDYRAMLDFAIDRRAGWLPSDRLYIKRLKQERDVAVLLLVDLSRSTGNKVYGSEQTVLDVEKEAIVLFCEALEVLGDRSAIAGFSGTGRLGVDYFRIRDFSEPLDDRVKWRINAMTRQRSTRMGGAIRHGIRQLESVDARVRLMILLGDGFPNDVDYKQEYALADTRVAASEAMAKNIAFRAITVNITADPRLDDLYGDVRHTVISDVRELPDKLLRIYSALTRY